MGLSAARSADRLHTRGAPAQLSERLRAAQEQLAEDGQLDPTHRQPVVREVLVLGNTPHPIDEFDRAEVDQIVQRVLDVGVVESGQGVPLALLIAARDDRIDRHRVATGRGLGLLDEDAEHAPLRRVERSRGVTRRGTAEVGRLRQSCSAAAKRVWITCKSPPWRPIRARCVESVLQLPIAGRRRPGPRSLPPTSPTTATAIP